jgi:hypothetical protein
MWTNEWTKDTSNELRSKEVSMWTKGLVHSLVHIGKFYLA